MQVRFRLHCFLLETDSDRLRVCLLVCVCVQVRTLCVHFMMDDVVVGESQETFTCFSEEPFQLTWRTTIDVLFCMSMCHVHTQFTCLKVWGKLHVICNGFGYVTPPDFFWLVPAR